MTWMRIRCVLAWPLLVIGSPFLLLASKVGGDGIRFALADTFEQILETENVKRPRPYRAVPAEARDSRTRTAPGGEITIAATRADSALEALDTQVTAF